METRLTSGRSQRTRALVAGALVASVLGAGVALSGALTGPSLNSAGALQACRTSVWPSQVETAFFADAPELVAQTQAATTLILLRQGNRIGYCDGENGVGTYSRGPLHTLLTAIAGSRYEGMWALMRVPSDVTRLVVVTRSAADVTRLGGGLWLVYLPINVRFAFAPPARNNVLGWTVAQVVALGRDGLVVGTAPVRQCFAMPVAWWAGPWLRHPPC